jgi:hypothetical protein
MKTICACRSPAPRPGSALRSGATPGFAGRSRTARLSQTCTDVIIGLQRDNSFPSRRAGLRAIDTYLGDIDPPDAAAILAKYRAELPDTYVPFSATPGMNTENDYVRIDGPSVWIEFSMQPGRSITGVHPHSVWRDRGSDYGGNR